MQILRGLPKTQNPESGIRNNKKKIKIRQHENFNKG